MIISCTKASKQYLAKATGETTVTNRVPMTPLHEAPVRKEKQPKGRIDKISTGHTHTQQQTNHSPLTRHTNTERATAQRQRRLIVEVVVAAPKLPPSAALLLSSLLHTRGTGHLPERTTCTGALRD